MKNTKFYICKNCGNITLSTGNTKIICCNNIIEAQKASKADKNDALIIEEIDGERYITSNHPMTKENYISFVAFLKGGEFHFFKQYPEWEVNVRIPKRGRGRLLWYAADTGLMYMDI